jgi:hypothetical protein
MDAVNAQFDLDLYLLLTNTGEDATQMYPTLTNTTSMYNTRIGESSMTPAHHSAHDDPRHHSEQVSAHPNQGTGINQTACSAYWQHGVLPQEMIRQEFQATQYHHPGQSMTAESSIQVWAPAGCPTLANFCLVARTTVPTPVSSSFMINTAQSTPYGTNSVLPTDNSTPSTSDSQNSQISKAFDHPRSQHEGQSSVYYPEVDLENQPLYSPGNTQSPVFSHVQPRGYSGDLGQSSMTDSTSRTRISLQDSSMGKWDRCPSHHSWRPHPKIPASVSELSKFPGVDDCAHRVWVAESIAKNLQQVRKSFEATEGIEIPEVGQRSRRSPKIWEKMPIPATIYSMQQGNMNNPNSLFLPASTICGGFRDDVRNITMCLRPLPDSRFFPSNYEPSDSSCSFGTIPRSSAVYHSPIRGFVNATSADYKGSGRMADRENCNRPTKKPRAQDIRRVTIPRARAEQPIAQINTETSQQAGSCSLSGSLLTPSEDVGMPSGALRCTTPFVTPEGTSAVLGSPDESNQSPSCGEGVLKSEIDTLFDEQINDLLDIPDV